MNIFILDYAKIMNNHQYIPVFSRKWTINGL